MGPGLVDESEERRENEGEDHVGDAEAAASRARSDDELDVCASEGTAS